MGLKIVLIITLLTSPSIGWSKNITQITQDFTKAQKVEIKNQLDVMGQAINQVIKLSSHDSKRYAVLIAMAARRYQIDPRIMIAILKVESDFNQKAISPTQDYSVAQINYKVWSKRFPKLNRAPLDFKLLASSDAYAVYRMAEILKLLQVQFSKTDKLWFGRYHSETEKFKRAYCLKLAKEFNKLLPYGPNLASKLPTSHPEEIGRLYLNDTLAKN